MKRFVASWYSLSFGKQKLYLFSKENENKHCIIDTLKKLKYKKSTNGNQELQNIQKEFSQGQVKIFLIFSKYEHYELELKIFYEPQKYRR